MEASFQSNMDWAKSELEKIKDPNFLATVMELLKKRPSAQEQTSLAREAAIRAEYTKHALESRKDVQEGRLLNIDQAKEYLSKLERPWK